MRVEEEEGEEEADFPLWSLESRACDVGSDTDPIWRPLIGQAGTARTGQSLICIDD